MIAGGTFICRKQVTGRTLSQHQGCRKSSGSSGYSQNSLLWGITMDPSHGVLCRESLTKCLGEAFCIQNGRFGIHSIQHSFDDMTMVVQVANESQLPSF
jgi:hypothetical protein